VLHNSQVAILIPVRNASPFIVECLESIKKQTFINFNVYLVNDHSTDDSLTLMEAFSRLDERFNVFQNNGLGIIDALDTAFEQSIEPLVTRMDADDLMPTNKLELLVDMALKHPEAMVSGMVNYFSNKPISKGYVNYQNWLNQRIESGDYQQWMYRECVIASANWMTSRQNIEAIGGFIGLNYPEDYDMVLKWLSNGKSILGIYEVTHLWREHPERTSRTSINYQQEAFFALKMRYWLENHANTSNPVLLLGKGKKLKLVTKAFANYGKTYSIISYSSKDELDMQLSSFNQPLVISCIYPPEKERLELENWLASHKLEMGKNWWYI